MPFEMRNINFIEADFKIIKNISFIVLECFESLLKLEIKSRLHRKVYEITLAN